MTHFVLLSCSSTPLIVDEAFLRGSDQNYVFLLNDNESKEISNEMNIVDEVSKQRASNAGRYIRSMW